MPERFRVWSLNMSAPISNEWLPCGDGQSLDDPSRLDELRRIGLTQLRDDPSFARYTRLAAKMLKVPVSLVSIVEADSQHFASQTGLPEHVAQAGGTPISHSFCQHVVLRGRPLVVENAVEHELVRENPAVDDLGVIAYLGVPIRTSSGNVLGSFCAINSSPRSWSEEELSFMHDIAAAVVNEIELRLSRDQLKQSYDDLKASEERQEELIHMIVHDLRSPLNGIVGGLDLLGATASFDQDEREMYDVCRESCDHLMDLIEDILEAGRIAKGDVQFDFSEFDLRALIEKVSNQAKLVASRRNSSFRESTARAPEKVLGDEGLLQRALLNLINNAFKYSSEGSEVVLTVERNVAGGILVFSVKDNGPGIPAERRAESFEPCYTTKQPGKGTGILVFSVKDNGPGIPEKDLQKIFGKYQIGGDRQNRRGSFGLGLTFCKMAADTHGGSISVKSEVGKGSDFRIEIPIDRN